MRMVWLTVFLVFTLKSFSQEKEEKNYYKPILLNYFITDTSLLERKGIEDWWNWLWRSGEVFTVIKPLEWFSIRSRWSIPLKRQGAFYYDSMEKEYEILPYGEIRYKFECSFYYNLYMKEWTLEAGLGYTHISLGGIFSRTLSSSPGGGFLIRKEIINSLYLESGLSFYYNLEPSDIEPYQKSVLFSLVFPFGIRYHTKKFDIMGGYTLETYFFEDLPRYYHLISTGGYFNLF